MTSTLKNQWQIVGQKHARQMRSEAGFFMRLNRIFNTVNNKERGCGQRSVVWLKRGQPCLHHFHVLGTVFSWRPFSSFSLGIILLPSDSRYFSLFGQTVFFLRCLRLRLAFVPSLFLRNLGRQSWRDVRPCVWPWGFAWVFRLTHHGSKVRQQLVCGVFARRNDCGFCVYLLSGQAALELSGQAVHERSCPRA